MKKTRHLNALQSFFLAIFGSLAIFAPAEAATILTDDFDTYSDGGLTGQGDWINLYQSCVVVDGKVGCGDDGDHGNQKEGTPLSSGAMSFGFRVYKNENLSSEYETAFGFIKTASYKQGYGPGLDIYYSNSKGIFVPAVGGDFFLNDPEVWHTATLVWDEIYANWYVDGVLVHENIPTYATTYAWVEFGVLHLGASMWVDNIGAGSPPPIAGYAPILTPTSPERNAETVVDFDDGFEVSGSVVIPTGNPHLYNNLIVTFRKPDSFFPAKTLTINLGGLTAGQSYNYSATTTVPITSSGKNFFKVGYTLTGSTWPGSYANDTLIEEALAFDKTWVKDSIYDAPAYLITPSIKPEQDALEDCGEYTGIDAVICNFRNFIVGAFLPSDDAIAQIGGTMDALKNKFPMNYARAIGDSFSAITAGIDDDAGFSLTILGNSSSADTSFFSQDIGAGATLGGTIKLMLTFLILMVFMFWGLGYMHRVLK